MKSRFLWALLLLAAGIRADAESVRLVKIIPVSDGGGKGKIANLVLGKKPASAVNPVSLLLLERNFLLVDQVHGMLAVTDFQGRIKTKITRFGKHRLISPVSGATENGRSFFISDSARGMVIRFHSIRDFDRVLFHEPQSRITGLSCYKGELFGTDTDNHCVVVLDRGGNAVRRIGERGSGPGEFNFPTHIFVNEQGIFVTDALNFRIQIFNHDGTFIRAFGKNGRHGGDFSKPKAIAADRKGRIFVSDVIFDNVQVFDMQGRFLAYFGGPGSGEEDLWMPGGIMINSQNEIFVCDTYNHRIKIYEVISERP